MQVICNHATGSEWLIMEEESSDGAYTVVARAHTDPSNFVDIDDPGHNSSWSRVRSAGLHSEPGDGRDELRNP